MNSTSFFILCHVIAPAEIDLGIGCGHKILNINTVLVFDMFNK